MQVNSMQSETGVYSYTYFRCKRIIKYGIIHLSPISIDINYVTKGSKNTYGFRTTNTSIRHTRCTGHSL